VKETFSSGLFFCSVAMACARLVLAAVSGRAPPSTSKSTLVSLNWSMTFWYAAARSEAEEQACASSVPDAPPN
jgi:hypothetical protein